jgi:membrane-associated phospholipid phosphatase
VFFLAAGNAVFTAPSPSLGAPAPGSFDLRVTRWLARPGSGRFLGRVPDLGGLYVWPVLPLLFYGADAVALGHSGRPWLMTADLNPQIRLVAYVEAIGWTLLVTGEVKYLVGRPRPYTASGLDRPDLRSRDSEDNLSFFSGHASAAFATGAFLAEDVSRQLLHGPLKDASPARRFLLGALLPNLVGYGVPTLIGVSRVIDLQHWPTDVAMGAVTGALISRLVYRNHFDATGAPLVRHPEALAGLTSQAALTVVPQVTTSPDGRAEVHLAAGLSGRF